MKRGGERKDSRRITMSVIATISPYESNRGGRWGCLGFLVYLFSGADQRYENILLFAVFLPPFFVRIANVSLFFVFFLILLLLYCSL